MDIVNPVQEESEKDFEMEPDKSSSSSVAINMALKVLPRDFDGTDPFEVLILDPVINESGCVPTAQRLTAAVKETLWILRPGWQSVSEIYRVLHDLHTRQRYTSLNLIYLRTVQLAAICGIEPVNIYDIKAEEDPDSENEAAVEDLLAGKWTKDAPRKEQDEKLREAAYVIPGNFSSGVMTGNIRIMLEDELQRATEALNRGGLGYQFSPGWMLGITDCDQVCYYVERILTLEQLMATSTNSREEELSTFFGRNKAVNLRSLVTRKNNQKLQKERQERWFNSQAELNAAFELPKQQEALALEPAQEDAASSEVLDQELLEFEDIPGTELEDEDVDCHLEDLELLV